MKHLTLVYSNRSRVPSGLRFTWPEAVLGEGGEHPPGTPGEVQTAHTCHQQDGKAAEGTAQHGLVS